MRMVGSVLAFFLLVFSVHWTIFRLNPGIADVRTAPLRSGKRPAPVSVDASVDH